MTDAPDTDWFDEARLGLFVHWDHASQQGLEVSWPLVGGISVLPRCQSVPVEQYHSSAATFDPVEWDPVAFARLARRAGARYVVFTAKHHSGYAMFDTAHSDHSVMASPHGRDILAGLADAVRAEGLRMGVYFSLSDWHHPDYPAVREEHKPYVLGATPPRPPAEQWERFVEVLFAQVREVLTGYGRIDVLWFDGQWERSAAEWHAADLARMARELQPGILLNDRLPGQGDFDTPEQFVPAQPPPRRWETCMTMNSSWGWVPEDTGYKSSTRLVHTLCETAARGGNLLLNVSPTGTGAVPPPQVERLEAIGRWMEANGESVVGTTPGLEPWQHAGPSTRRGDRVYAHLLAHPVDAVPLRGVPVKRVERVVHLASGRELAFDTATTVMDSFLPDPSGEVRVEVPADLLDPHATVLAVDLRG